MSQQISVVVSLSCIFISLSVMLWCLYAYKTDKLTTQPIKPINNYEPLTSSPYISNTVLAIFRLFCGIISLIVTLYDIFFIRHVSAFYSYYIWSWLLMITYFIFISLSKFFNLLSPTNSILQIILRTIIWIIYQIVLSLSVSNTIIIFLWLYVYLISFNKDFANYIYYFSDITMVLCNFLFIMSDFFINDIPLRFHYGSILLLISWIYLLFSWLIYILTNKNILTYPFFDPTQHSTALYYIIWSVIHFFSWVITYNLSFCKIKYQRKKMRKRKRNCKRNHLEKIDEELKNRQQHIPSTTITIEPDGTSAFNGVLNLKNMNISSPDLMLPNHTFEEDYEDETSPLNGLKLDSNVSHHSALTQRFVNLKNYRDLLSDTLHDNESIYEYKDNDMSSNYMSPRTKSFNERMSSVTVLGTISPTVKSIVEFSDRKALIENELINTEESYLNGLKILLNEFIKPIFKKQLIDRKFEKQITCNLPQLICFHEQFLKELYVGPISKVFNKQSDYFKIYISYISEYENILNLFGVFRKKK
eukprot:545489_1